MLGLHRTHPRVLEKFRAGMFTVQKTKRIFSSIATDQAHGQNNAHIKGDGGAVGLMDNPSALQRWMVTGPEVARVIGEFDMTQEHHDSKTKTLHHNQTESIQKSFDKDVKSLVSVIEELGNPFLEDTTDIWSSTQKTLQAHQLLTCAKCAEGGEGGFGIICARKAH